MPMLKMSPSCWISTGFPDVVLQWMATARPTGSGTGARYFATNHEGVTFYREDTPFELNDACEMPEGPAVRPVGR